MDLIVDLHIHSHYSRATSKECNVEGLYRWGKIKGINVIGTGDFTHPDWFAEMREKLVLAEPGLYKLREDIAQELDKTLPESVRNNLFRYLLTVEISNIYSKKEKGRRLHNLIISPSFEAASSINARLSRIGNLKADGRPILGMDSKDLLKISLEMDPNNLFIPAHIWTPWFAMFGSKSGFNSIEEAFEELTPHIRAVETGLSSDPYMNWRLNELQHITLVSNSDAHSPQKLGREANILHCKLDYFDIIEAIKTGDNRFVGTIEFFPQEGKYHYDGHRLCNIKLKPEETKKLNSLCPKCGRPLTVGVDYRVGELANHTEEYKPLKHKTVEYIIPLVEIIAEKIGTSTASKKVWEEYERMYTTLGDEFSILRKLSIEEVKEKGFSEMAKLIERMRKGDVHIEPGYDGVYGVIKLFANETERKQQNEQMALEW